MRNRGIVRHDHRVDAQAQLDSVDELVSLPEYGQFYGTVVTSVSNLFGRVPVAFWTDVAEEEMLTSSVTRALPAPRASRSSHGGGTRGPFPIRSLERRSRSELYARLRRAPDPGDLGGGGTNRSAPVATLPAEDLIMNC